MAASAREIVSEIYDAWRARDLDRVSGHLAEDFSVLIKVPETMHPLGGETSGKQPALDLLERIIGQFEFLAYDVCYLLAEGEHAAAQVHLNYRDTASGEAIDTKIGHFWTLRDGKAVKLTEYHDLDQVQAFAEKTVAGV